MANVKKKPQKSWQEKLAAAVAAESGMIVQLDNHYPFTLKGKVKGISFVGSQAVITVTESDGKNSVFYVDEKWLEDLIDWAKDDKNLDSPGNVIFVTSEKKQAADRFVPLTPLHSKLWSGIAVKMNSLTHPMLPSCKVVKIYDGGSWVMLEFPKLAIRTNMIEDRTSLLVWAENKNHELLSDDSAHKGLYGPRGVNFIACHGNVNDYMFKPNEKSEPKTRLEKAREAMAD